MIDEPAECLCPTAVCDACDKPVAEHLSKGGFAAKSSQPCRHWRASQDCVHHGSPSPASALFLPHIQEDLARYWYESEWNGNPPRRFEDLSPQVVAEIRLRIASLYSGEIKTTELGDVAVFAGKLRPRTIWDCHQIIYPSIEEVRGEKRRREAWEKKPAPKEPFMHRVKERQIANWYDTLQIGHRWHSINTDLFGRRNLGQTRLTNMVVAGALSADQTSHLLSVRLVEDLPTKDIKDMVARTLSTGVLTLSVGERPIGIYNMLDLQRNEQPLNQIVPPRQTFHGLVTWFGQEDKDKKGHRPIERLHNHLAGRELTGMMQIHIRGFRTRDVG